MIMAAGSHDGQIILLLGDNFDTGKHYLEQDDDADGLVRLFYLVTILTLASITLNKMTMMASLVQMCKNARLQQLQE